jgi:hypothetical protein
LAALVFLIGCVGNDMAVVPKHKCQLVVVLDKTNSVTYVQKREHIRQELMSKFDRTYDGATNNIQSSLLVITGSTSVFPVLYRFEVQLPAGEDDNRGYQEALLQWNTEKRKWLAGRVKEVVGRIDSPCRSNTTDIFSIFSGIAQVQKNDGPWDSINVMVFSDMVNTCSSLNMRSGVNIQNAREKGKTMCKDLIAGGRMAATGNENLYFKVYTPDMMENTEAVNLVWTSFFQQWGLKPDQYRFE